MKRPMRAGGYALIGASAAALAIGTAAALSGSDTPSDTVHTAQAGSQMPSSAAPPAPGSPSKPTKPAPRRSGGKPAPAPHKGAPGKPAKGKSAPAKSTSDSAGKPARPGVKSSSDGNAPGHVDADTGVQEASAARPAPAPGGRPAPGNQAPGRPGVQARREPDTHVDVRVYNNSNVKGLAQRAGDDLRKQGWNVTKVDNFDGQVSTSTVFYRPGTPEEAAARAIARQFGMHAEKRFKGIEKASDGVIVIVTQDFRDNAQ